MCAQPRQGRIVTYARNSLGQVTGVVTQKDAAAAFQTIASGMSWRPMSNLLGGYTYGNGLVASATYDLDYRLTSLTLKNGATDVINLGYAYGDGLNLTAINDYVAPGNTVTLAYTPANRLGTATGPWGRSAARVCRTLASNALLT